MEVVIQMENKILELLSKKKNVIIMGAPGTGKSRIINEICEKFEKNTASIQKPAHEVGATVPIPAVRTSGNTLEFLKKKNRKVFRTTLHQNSKYRDFLTGIVPIPNGSGGFQINEGILYRANEFAKQEDSAALLVIDELNRGPAVEVFGGSIVAIESDKRLSSDNGILPMTQTFEIVDPVDGKLVEYAFSPNLYILAAMNQADVSVAPLDVAFLRRWQPFRLKPDYVCLEKHFNINTNDNVPEVPTTNSDVYLAAVKALIKINKRIFVGRGADYQLGQGVFLSTKPSGDSVDKALEFVCEVWDMIFAHIEELFFGDAISISYVVNANNSLSPYELEEVSFAGEIKTILTHEEIDKTNIYDLYRAIGEEN